jgi:hypothetical protein
MSTMLDIALDVALAAILEGDFRQMWQCSEPL